MPGPDLQRPVTRLIIKAGATVSIAKRCGIKHTSFTSG